TPGHPAAGWRPRGGVVLLRRGARQGDADLTEDVLGEARAVEACGGRAAVAVRDAGEAGGHAEDATGGGLLRTRGLGGLRGGGRAGGAGPGTTARARLARGLRRRRRRRGWGRRRLLLGGELHDAEGL